MVSRKAWNALAADFESEVCDITRETKSDAIARAMRRVVPRRPRGVLVDLGCGLGTFIARYGERYAESIGVEHAPRIIGRAKTALKGRKVRWLTSNIPPAVRRIGRRADLAVCMNVITMPQARARAAMWASLARVTRRGGHALIVVPSIESDRMVERVAYGTTPSEARAAAPDGLVDRGGSRQKHFARAELEGLLAAHGFRVEAIRRVTYPWAKEGLRKPRGAGARMPWDWLVLAQRI